MFNLDLYVFIRLHAAALNTNYEHEVASVF